MYVKQQTIFRNVRICRITSKKGYAYETSTAIYFDISKLDKYPILSSINLEDQKAGARVEIDEEKKRNPYDFALWIKAPENHLMKWNSSWGTKLSRMAYRMFSNVIKISRRTI